MAKTSNHVLVKSTYLRLKKLATEVQSEIDGSIRMHIRISQRLFPEVMSYNEMQAFQRPADRLTPGSADYFYKIDYSSKEALFKWFDKIDRVNGSFNLPIRINELRNYFEESKITDEIFEAAVNLLKVEAVLNK